MKISYLSKTTSLGGLVVVSMIGIASAAVTVVGVDTTAGANWRTGANLEPDSEYGTAGYVVFGLNEADSVYTQPYDVSSTNAGNAYSLPAGISVTTVDTNIGMWSGNGNFGTMQDPGAGNAITNAPVLANSNGTRQWTISRSLSAAHRITFMTASGDNEGTEYTLTLNDGSGAVMTNYDHTANGLAYHVFDVSAGTSDIVLDIASTAENRSVTGIAFDAIPEPSSALLVGLAAIGCCLRRKR